MNITKILLILVCLLFVETTSALSLCGINCIKEGTKSVGDKLDATGRNTQDKLDATGRNTQDKLDATGRNTQDKLDATGRNTQDKLDATGRNYQDKLDATGRNYQDKLDAKWRKIEQDKQEANNKINATIFTIKKDTSNRANQFNNFTQNIKTKTNSDLNNIRNSTRENIGYIQDKSQQEIQRATEDVENTAHELDRYVRENPVDKEGLESAFSAAAAAKNSNLGKAVKKFGIQVNKTIDDVELSEPAKALKGLGTRASTENVENGISNTVEYLESSKEGKSLHDLGKKVSTEKITKGVTNTIDYWQQPDIGSKIDPTNPNSDTRQVVKETIHDVESSELAQELNDAGTQVSIENVENRIDKIVADFKKTDAYKNLQNTLLSTVMTKPENLELIGSEKILSSGARPVYYINGIKTLLVTMHA